MDMEFRTKEEFFQDLNEMCDPIVVLNEYNDNPNAVQWTKEFVSQHDSKAHTELIIKLRDLRMRTRSEDERQIWAKMISDVLETRPNLGGISNEIIPEQERVKARQLQQRLTIYYEQSKFNPKVWEDVLTWFKTKPEEFSLAVFPKFRFAVIGKLRQNCEEFFDHSGNKLQDDAAYAAWSGFKQLLITANPGFFSEHEISNLSK